jgi:predicted secreted Zn-dependent protease/LysM repeat protein
MRGTEDPGLGTVGRAAVMCAVFAVVLLGIVVLDQRQDAIDAFAEASARAVAIAEQEQADAGGTAPPPTPSPVPAPDAGGPNTYTVQRGDSLFSVAAALGLSPNELVFWNKDTYPTLQSTPALKAGWVLRTAGPPLPTAAPRATPTPVPQVAAPDIPGLPSFGPGDFPASHAVTVSYYAVTGSTPREIELSMQENGPWSEWAGANAQAQVEVRPSFNFGFQSDGGGDCSVVIDGPVPLTLTYHVTLPSWTPPEGVSSVTIDWWIEIINETVVHEAHHITLYESYLPAMNDAVRTGTCESVEADLERLWTDASRVNCEFDLDEYGYAAGLTLESCLAN